MSDEDSNCFNRHVKDFLICVTVHKARNLRILNGDTFAVVSVNGSKKKTKVFQNSDCPFFNEVRINL